MSAARAVRLGVVGVLACSALGVLACSALAATAGVASAQAPDGPSIGGRLRDADGSPVEGVTITVARGGETVGSAVSDGDGEWRVDVAGPGTYEVTIDTGTLPDGVGLRDPDRATLDSIRVRGGLKIATFLLGEGAASGSGRLERFLDLSFDGIRLGIILAVASLGLSLVFGVTGLTNFAHGELVTFGALMAYLFSTSAVFGGVPLWVAGLLATGLGGAYGLAHERVLFRPLRRRRTGNVALIVVTIGLSQFLRYAYLVVFGGSPRPYDEYTVQVDLDLGPISPRPKDLAVMLVGAAVLVAVALALQRSRLGTAMRATSDSGELSAASGIDVDRVILATWVGCGALAALAGVLLGLSETVSWDMGFTLLLLMFATVVLGGIGTGFGPMLGGLLIGLASQVSTYWFSPKYRVGVALAVLIGAVLVRPQGLLGKRERVG